MYCQHNAPHHIRSRFQPVTQSTSKIYKSSINILAPLSILLLLTIPPSLPVPSTHPIPKPSIYHVQLPHKSPQPRIPPPLHRRPSPLAPRDCMASRCPNRARATVDNEQTRASDARLGRRHRTVQRRIRIPPPRQERTPLRGWNPKRGLLDRIRQSV